MAIVAQYSGEVMLHVTQRAHNPESRESNEKQWESMRKDIREVLTASDVKVNEYAFTNSHYKHGGVNLTVKYEVTRHLVRPVKQIEDAEKERNDLRSEGYRMGLVHAQLNASDDVNRTDPYVKDQARRTSPKAASE